MAAGGIDPRLVHAWLAGRSLARGLPAPVADSGGWRVDTDGEAELRRYVFPAVGPGLIALLDTIAQPRIFVKLCADADTLRALLPPGWSITDANRMMVTDTTPAPCPVPPGYALRSTTDDGVTHATIVTPDGEEAASGHAAEHGGAFVYDRIVTHALTDRILFEGKHATGVAYLVGDSDTRHEARARKEVLLCAGAIASPQILQRSGVGPAELLNKLDIPVVHDLPGVGQNLQDHLEMYLQYACTQPVSLYPSLMWWNQPAIGAEWMFLGTGIGASNQFEAGGFIRSSEAFEWPNIQYHFLPVAINYNGTKGVQEHGFQAHVGSMRSPSRGRVHVKSKDPREYPSILFNYMASEQDWQEFRDGIRLTREIMQQPALDPYRGREISPGIDVQSDEALDQFVREHAETAYHPSCSCKMGTDEMAVVDGQGRVHGMQSLRVVDASIMPIITTGNLNAPTIMIAEKIADKIRGRQPLPRSTADYFVAGDKPARGKPLREVTHQA